jgi:hypothetical protein
MGDLGKHQAFFDALHAALTKPSSPIKNIDQFDREFEMALSRELRPPNPVSISPARCTPLPEDVEPTIPELMPDEIIHGWRGRVAALNSLSKIRQVESLLRLCAEETVTELGDDPDFIECAAAALGVSRQELLRRHTLPPFFDALGELKQNKPGTKSAKHLRAYLRQVPFRVDGKEALFCRQCAKEDLASRKYSYWRRNHHLPGVLCCSKHGTPLLSAGTHEAFDRCPHHFLDAQPKECAIPHDELARQILLRYSQIAADILDCAPLINSTAASFKLGQRANALGLRISSAGRRKTPSTCVMELLPLGWLQKTFPRVRWETGKFISTFDGACSPRATRYTTVTLCLLAAVLYEDADQALTDLLDQSKPVDQREVLGFNFWASKEVQNLYVTCKGNVNRVAERLGLPVSSVSIGLLSQGLPGLGKSAGLKKALKALSAGDSLDVACRKANVTCDSVINLLLAGSRRLMMALEMMSEEEPELVLQGR